jgi:acyl carrier protein
MDSREITSKIKEHVSRVTGIAPDKISDDASYFNDLGLDSLSVMELTVDLEYAFKIKVRPEELPDMPTIQHTVALVQKHLPAAQA